MNKELNFITVFPSDKYFTWQVHLWLENLSSLGYEENAYALMFSPKGRPIIDDWDELRKLYPKANILLYEDDNTVAPYIGTYIPILRLWTMYRFLTDYPEIGKTPFLYYDSDVLLTEKFNVSHLLDDNICYASDTNSYINASYFDSKIRDVLPEKLEEYKKIDVLDTAAKIVGINREICEKNNLHSGGTQYLLKNSTAQFWKDCFDKCIPALSYLRGINKEYFPSETKGLQVWTIDMWLVLWHLWKYGQEVRVVKEMDFSWATDGIHRINETTIFHNAGVTGEFMDNIPYFYKGKYHLGKSPFSDSHLDVVLNNKESQKKCTWWYAHKLDELRKKYNLT